MTSSAYITIAVVLLGIIAATIAGALIETPRNERGTRLRRWMKFQKTLK